LAGLSRAEPAAVTAKLAVLATLIAQGGRPGRIWRLAPGTVAGLQPYSSSVATTRFGGPAVPPRLPTAGVSRIIDPIWTLTLGLNETWLVIGSTALTVEGSTTSTG